MNSYATVTISGDLISHLRLLYDLGSRGALSGKVVRHGLNAYTEHALTAYIIGAASVEAFVNEALLVQETEWLTKGSALWQLRRDWVERLDLREKIIIVSHLLLGQGLDAGAQPLQDLILLVKLRNEVIHYKRGAPPKFISEFIQRGIALSSRWREQLPSDAPLSQPWAWDMQCTEGIRWANNTCCQMVHKLVESIPIDKAEYDRRGVASVAQLDDFQFVHSSARTLAGAFAEISEEQARAFYSTLGLDPDSE
jgi:hypothetical protein